MPITSWKVTLSSDKKSQMFAIEQIKLHQSVELGPQIGENLAIVVDSDTPEHDAMIGAWLTQLKGVVAVSLVFTDFSDVHEFDRDSFAEVVATTCRFHRGSRESLVAHSGHRLDRADVLTAGNITNVADGYGYPSEPVFSEGDDHVSR